jgi:hypothetical protein
MNMHAQEQVPVVLVRVLAALPALVPTAEADLIIRTGDWMGAGRMPSELPPPPIRCTSAIKAEIRSHEVYWMNGAEWTPMQYSDSNTSRGQP